MLQPIVQSLYLPGKLPGGEPEAQSADARPGNANAATQQQRAAEQQTTFDKELSAEEQKQVEDLQRIDRNVRAHEAAHQAAAGGLARGLSFSYQQGPDGKQYAVAGEVQIDTAPVEGNPQATIAKAQRIRAAASAPADPSGQDRQVAAQASAMEAQARQELQEQSKLEASQQSDDTAVESPEDTHTDAPAPQRDAIPSGTDQSTERSVDIADRARPQRDATQRSPFSADAIRQFTSPFGYQQQGTFFNAQA